MSDSGISSMSRQHAASLPFALRWHETPDLEAEVVTGNHNVEWSWVPPSGAQTNDLTIYASGGFSTTRQTYNFGQVQWDHGEAF